MLATGTIRRTGVAAHECRTSGRCDWGPGEEDLAQRLVRSAGQGVREIPTSLEELIALCESARLFVGGDTGPMHFAAAVGTPIVAIFGPTSSDRNGPFRREDIVVEKRLPCRPCYERDRCPLETLAVHARCHGRSDA